MGGGRFEARLDVHEASVPDLCGDGTGIGEPPRFLPIDELRGVALGNESRNVVAQVGEIGAAAALRLEPAAGNERPRERGKQAIMVEDPMEGGGAEDRIDGLSELRVCSWRRGR